MENDNFESAKIIKKLGSVSVLDVTDIPYMSTDLVISGAPEILFAVVFHSDGRAAIHTRLLRCLSQLTQSVYRSCTTSVTGPTTNVRRRPGKRTLGAYAALKCLFSKRPVCTGPDGTGSVRE